MADADSTRRTEPPSHGWKPWVPMATGVLVFVVIAGGLILLQANSATLPSPWSAIAQFAAVVAIALAAAMGIRVIVPSRNKTPLFAASGRPADDQGDFRNRIALIVLTIGSIAIIALSGAVIIAFVNVSATNEPVQEKIDALLMGIFTAVLPVFATWVGTVIAFYFSNESFRQAATAAREAAQGLRPHERVSDRMIEFDKIVKIVRNRDAVTSITMTEVIRHYSSTVTRVIIFDTHRVPVFVIPKRLIPAELIDGSGQPTAAANETIDVFRKRSTTIAEETGKFSFVSEQATVDDARTIMAAAGVMDLFVTKTGQRTEAVLGWVPNDKLGPAGPTVSGG